MTVVASSGSKKRTSFWLLVEFRFERKQLLNASPAERGGGFACRLHMAVSLETKEASPETSPPFENSSRDNLNRGIPIINYVNRSSDVLRKVRLGQPLTSALCNGPTQLNPNLVKHIPPPVKKEFLDEFSIFRNLALRPSGSIDSFTQNTNSEHLRTLQIRYGRPVQLQTEDGDFLLLENDGTMRKVPPSHHKDSRTVLTFFPVNSKTGGNNYVKPGDRVFLVQGAAPSFSRNGAVYADSRQLKSHPPKVLSGDSGNKLSTRENNADTITWSLTNVSRSPSQLKTKMDASQTTVLLDSREIVSSGDKLVLSQNEYLLCYDLRVQNNSLKGVPPAQLSVTLNSKTLKQTVSQIRSQNIQEIAPLYQSSNNVWLRFKSENQVAAAPFSNNWIVRDVEFERGKILQQLDRVQRSRTRQPLTPMISAAFNNDIHRRSNPVGNDDLKLSNPDRYSKTLETNGQCIDAGYVDPASNIGHNYQHRAALIISRFFRSVCRLHSPTDRAREIFRRRWRERHPEKYRSPLFELTNKQQLRVLQLYNPHIYGSLHPTRPIATAATSIRLSHIPQMEQHKQIKRQQVLERMDHDAAFLNRTSQQKTKTPTSSVVMLHEMYQRRSLASRDRPITRAESEKTNKNAKFL